jgi:hypothetical protein
MRYKLFKNSADGMHCVQACLQMLLYSFGKPVLSLDELDNITHHEPEMMTWMSDALLWLTDQGFQVDNYENLDYRRFAEEGKEYLKTIWDKETFELQDRYSDLDREQMMAGKLIRAGALMVDTRLSLDEIRKKTDDGYFTMLSVNPHALNGCLGYGSHLVVVKSIGHKKSMLFDPDMGKPYSITNERLEEAISDERKNDFNAIFVR